MRRATAAIGTISTAVFLAAAVFMAAAGHAQENDAATPAATAASETSEPARLASRSLLLDAAMAGSRLVVVGERGHVLTSDDRGQSWKQSAVPTRANLTGVFFGDGQHGWAVGHDEVILRSQDGGMTWTLTHNAPEKQQPLLDVWFKDANTGLAIGAYGTMLATTDGGVTWSEKVFEPQEPGVPGKPAQKPADPNDKYADEEMTGSDAHLNSIERSATGKLYIAAEAGHLFRSEDDGATWVTLPSPYEGSFFGVLPLDGESLLAFGLRGHLYRSDDAGMTWKQIETGSVAMLTDGVRVDSEVAICGLAGTLLVSHDGGTTFTLHQEADRRGMSALLALDADHFLVVGEGGVKIVTP